MEISTTQDLVVENKKEVRKVLKTWCVTLYVESTKNCLIKSVKRILLEIKRKESVRINCTFLRSLKQTTRRSIFDDNERFIGRKHLNWSCRSTRQMTV